MNVCNKTAWYFFVLIAVLFTGLTEGMCSESVDALKSRLKSDNPHVRLSAVEELGTIREDESVDALIGVVESGSEDWKIQARAMRLLSVMENPRIPDLLMKALTDTFFTNDCPALKWNAVVGLGNFKRDSRVLNALIYALGDSVLYIREAAIQSLGEIGDARAVPYLVPSLQDKSFAIKHSAIRALGKIGDVQAVPFLKEIADSEDELIKNEVRTVSESLRKRSL